MSDIYRGLGTVHGVVFILRDRQGRILMERCPKKAARHGAEWFIPGGRVEEVDDGSTAEALLREMWEDLACFPSDFSRLPIIDAGGRGHPWFLVQPFLVTDWQGDVPDHCLDHPDVPLRWMDPAAAIQSPSAVVRALIAAAVPAIGWRTTPSVQAV